MIMNDMASRLTTYEQREEIRKKAKDLIDQVNNEVIPRLNKISNQKVWLPINFPEINFNTRAARTAGVFISRLDGSCEVSLNAHYLKAHPEYTLNQTLPHEVAHYVVYTLFKERISSKGRFSAHGSAWQEIMNFFGLEATRCHSLEQPSTIKKKKTFVYKCNCTEHEFSSIRHNHALRGSKYTCRKCSSQLVYKGE